MNDRAPASTFAWLPASLSLDYNYQTNPVDVAENDDATLLMGIAAEF
jgi:hypothetical protein